MSNRQSNWPSNRQSNWQGRWLLAVVLVLAAGAGFVLALPWGVPVLRAIVGVSLVLMGPGLAVTTVLLPLKQLGSAEHVLAACATSIAVTVIGGIVLNATPWGLQPLSWLTLLSGVTVAAALTAMVRLRRIRMGTGGRLGNAASSRRGGESIIRGVQVPTARLALPMMAILLLGLAVYVARIPAPAAQFQGYTTLWMAPNGEQAAPGVRIGVQSAEFEPAGYRLEVRVNGQVSGVWPDLALAPNQAWQTQVALPETGGAGLEELEALLYRNDAPRIVYRQVRIRPNETDRTARTD